MSRKGRYKPKRPEKYIGDVSRIIYRSSWERKLMVFLDSHTNILRWSSEPFPILYISPVDQRQHRYYVDFYAEVFGHDGKTRKMLIEVKPLKETKKPAPPKSTASPKRYKNFLYEARTYAVNQEKWKAARAFCVQNGWDFRVFTERELKIER